MSTQDEIATSLTHLCTLLVSMGYIKDSEVNWAPHTNPPLNTARCHELNYDDAAINLLQKIPWPTAGTIFHDSIVVDYGNDDELELSRDPVNYMIDEPEEIGTQELDSWVFPLTYGMENGQTL